MKVEKNVEGRRMELFLDGKFDSVSAPELEKEISASLDGIEELIIDMGNVDYISSAGLRTVLYLDQAMKEKGEMKIRNVPELVYDIFAVTGIDKIIKLERK